MSNLLYKEWHLAVHSVVYLFLLIGALLLVPAYPYGMIFFFGCLGLYFTSQFARENSDAFYTATLPIKKRHVVKSKCLLFVTRTLYELDGTPHVRVDEYMKHRLQNKLIRAILKDSL